MNVFTRLRHGLIVSCQAPVHSPLHVPEVMAAIAQAAIQQGAVGVRVDTPEHVHAVRQRFSAPVIGLWKRQRPGCDVYITPRFEEASAVANAGADFIAIDATLRQRPELEPVSVLIERIHTEVGKYVIADVDTVEAAIAAAGAGADAIATTLFGYTAETQCYRPPAWQLLIECVKKLDIPVICEGGIASPYMAKHALDLGAYAVVVGTAITGIDSQVHAYSTSLAPASQKAGTRTLWASPVQPSVPETSSFIPFRPEDVEQSIPERFEQQVVQYHDRMAIKSHKQRYTYATLNQAANRVAHAILSQGSRDTRPVVVLVNDETLAIVTILGVLKAGKSYVPLDPSLPRVRMTYILEDSQARLILTHTPHLALADELAQHGCRVLNIDQGQIDFPSENPGLSISPDAHAHLLYTSGSTGQPKGVIQTHRNLLHLVRNTTNDFRITPDDRISHHTPTAVTRTFAALLNGAAFLPFDVKQEGLAQLVGWLIRQDITLYYFVPTAFRQFVNSLTPAQTFPKLRLICLSGETVNYRDIALYQQYFSPDTLLVNGLGTTETGSISRYFIEHKTRISDTLVPVGYAVDDVEILVVDEMNRAVEAGQLGEIAVKSHYLSPGYWDQPVLSRQVFFPDSDDPTKQIYLTGDVGRLAVDGCLSHLGRKDFQVKIRGQRVEVAEVETALLELGMIKETVVVARDEQPGELRLIAYFVSRCTPAPVARELRNALRYKLPDYMIPSAFVMLDSLPLTPTGKVDRQALPAPARGEPALTDTVMSPRTSIEEVLVKIWAKVLGQERVGIHNSFFELGGHSLLASQIIARVRDTFRVELPLRILWDAPTVADMAVAIAQHQAERVQDKDIAQVLAEIEGLSETQVRQLLDEDQGSSL